MPALSEDFTAADEAIRKRVTDLVEELLRIDAEAEIGSERPNAWTVSGGMTWIPAVGGLLVYASPRRFFRGEWHPRQRTT